LGEYEITSYVSLFTRLSIFFLMPSLTGSIESTGQYPPEDLFPESIKILKEKIQTLKSACARLQNQWQIGVEADDAEMAGPS
jgi:hypothetical protein